MLASIVRIHLVTFARRPLAVIVMLAIAATVAAWLARERPAPAPEVAIATIGGETLNMGSMRGNVVLVNFWATSCVVCVREMPRLADIHRRYHAQGLETVAVAMSYDPPNYVVRFAEQNGLPFRVALDPVGEVAKRFGNVRLTPTTVVIDRRGRVVKKIVGAPDFAELDRVLEKALAENS
jgi:peroxiredoxin